VRLSNWRPPAPGSPTDDGERKKGQKKTSAHVVPALTCWYGQRQSFTVSERPYGKRVRARQFLLQGHLDGLALASRRSTAAASSLPAAGIDIVAAGERGTGTANVANSGLKEGGGGGGAPPKRHGFARFRVGAPTRDFQNIPGPSRRTVHRASAAVPTREGPPSRFEVVGRR